jgi:hypothetical protein
VRASGRLKLLSHVLGDETPSQATAALELELSGRDGEVTERDTAVRGVYKALPWSCRLSQRAEGSWSIAFRSLLYREYLALHIALLPVLRRLLLERGVAMSIGAAFVRNGDATLIAGRTGRGKTSLVLGAIERGASFVGDEYIGLHETGDVTPVIRSLALRRATLSLAPRTFARLSASRKLSLRIAQAAAALTRGFLQPLVHIPPRQLIEGAPEAAGHLRRFFWLEAGDGVRCEALPTGEAAEQLATLQQLHDVAYGDLGAIIGGAPYPARWREIAARALEGVSCYRLSLPARADISRKALDLVLEPDA